MSHHIYRRVRREKVYSEIEYSVAIYSPHSGEEEVLQGDCSLKKLTVA